MKARNKEDLDSHFEMVRECLEDALQELKLGLGNPNELSHELIRKYKQDIIEMLDMPFGGTLSPGEYAEMVILRFLNAHSDHEAAATATI